MTMNKERKAIGLAPVGSGTIGRIRAMLARNYPGVSWLGLCDIKEELAKELAKDTKADFYTTDYRELLKRSEITAMIIATDEITTWRPSLQRLKRALIF